MLHFNRITGRTELHQAILAGFRKREGREDSANHLSSTIRLYFIVQFTFSGSTIQLFMRTFYQQGSRLFDENEKVVDPRLL